MSEKVEGASMPVETRVVAEGPRGYRAILGAGAVAVLSITTYYYSGEIMGVAESICSIAEELFF